MTGSSWLRSAVVVAAGVMAVVMAASPPAYSKKKKAPTPTPTLTPTPTPTPESKVWNFDEDKPHKMASGWKILEGDWEVIPDPSAPSQPNTLGLPPGRLTTSLMHGLAYTEMALLADPAEYGDFTLKASIKPIRAVHIGGFSGFDCSGGLIFRYSNASNFYVLAMGCPSDYFQLIRMYKGTVDVVQQKVIPIDPGNWYKVRVEAQGDHFVCYHDDKMVFDAQDGKLGKGRIGVWAQNDSEVRFDDITLTLPIGQSTGGAAAPAEGAGAPGAAAPPPPPPPPPP